jgi:hypothetical protein
MKTKFLYILFVLIVLIISSCDNIINDNSGISGKLKKYSECKNNLKSTEATNVLCNKSCVEYHYNSSTEILKLSHINAGFNCCPEKLYCTVTTNSDTIIIQEYEKAALCDCNCLYDLVIEIIGITPEKYVIKFIEPYAVNSKKIIFNVDFSAIQEGSFCVIRDKYPWGIYN